MTDSAGQKGAQGSAASVLPRPSAYRLSIDTSIEEVQQRGGPALWAVRSLGSCLNTGGEWEYEPLPSSRDDEFIKRCRWPTPIAAYAAWLATREGSNPTGRVPEGPRAKPEEPGP